MASAVERLQEEAKRSGPGFVASLGLHLVLLLAMALIFVGQGRSAQQPVLDGAWLVPIEERAAGRAAAPVKIEAFEFQPREREPEESEPEEVRSPSQKKDGAALRAVPVQPAEVANLFEGRRPPLRERILAEYGGNERAEQAIAAGLRWLARQQRPEGNWRLHQGYPDAGDQTLRTDTGATALALLAFLGAGQTHRQGSHQEVVRQGLDWLTAIQKPDGDFHDHVELGRQTAFYAHSQATIAVCEAYAMTGDAALREPAEQAVGFLLDVQRQSSGGGWKYRPEHDKGDLSVTGWALMALHTARAAGLHVPQESFAEASHFLDSVQERQGARYKYEPTDPPGRVSVAMTAEGLLCRQFLGWSKEHPALQDGVQYLTRPEHLPEWSAGRRNVYAWYYASHVLHNLGGDEWKEWYHVAREAIVAHQVKGGRSQSGRSVRGSWHPSSPRGAPLEYADRAGRLYITTLCILILETPYRHRPIGGEPLGDGAMETR